MSAGQMNRPEVSITIDPKSASVIVTESGKGQVFKGPMSEAVWFVTANNLKAVSVELECWCRGVKAEHDQIVESLQVAKEFYEIEFEICHFCPEVAETPEGSIYVRAQVGSKWQSVPCCRPCWDKRKVSGDHE